ncbi:MAG: hypothetical protein ICV77_02105 [Cyanobacteria bacterium Co-bin8]|nr:hypothetical protein [Cyanobacteria bacterium Co-bin8]
MAITDPRQEIEQVCILLEKYFDLGSCEVDAVMTDWLQQFELMWIQSAIVEALYQGRYKILSVDHILRLWGRRGQPLRHYNREFEAIFSGQPVLFPNPLPTSELKPATKPRIPLLPAAPLPAEEAVLPHRDNPFLQPQLDQWGYLSAQPPDPSPEETEAPAVEDPWESAVPEAASEAVSTDGPAEELWAELSVNHPGAYTASSEASLEPLGIEPFKPLPSLHQKTEGWLGAPVDMSAGHPEPIQTFVPRVNSTELDQRLQAVARRPEHSS